MLVDLETGRLADQNLNEVHIQFPESFLLAEFILNLRIQDPVFRALVFDLDLLDLGRADCGVELEFLGGVIGLANAFAHNVQVLRDCLFKLELNAC